MTKLASTAATILLTTAVVVPSALAQPAADQLPRSSSSSATSQKPQSNVPAEAQQVEDAIESAVDRFRIGVSGGVAVDPELINIGAHAAFAPVFHRAVEFRPGLEIGVGELTTLLGINLDVLYTLPGATTRTRWMPYIGGGPNFALSHRGFGTDDVDKVDIDGGGDVNGRNRFDFSDTDFNGGFNFIAGARSQGGMFLEMKATAWGVSMVRLLAGFNF